MTYLLYHDRCNDGLAAATVVWNYYEAKGLTVIPQGVSYGQDPPTLPPGSEVIIVDFSYPVQQLLELAKDKSTVIVLDHHETARNELCFDAFIKALNLSPEMSTTQGINIQAGHFMLRNIHGVFDMEKSGAILAWEHFYPGKPAPKLLEYVQDRDLWKFNLPHSRAINAYLKTIGGSFPTWLHVLNQMETDRGFEDIRLMGYGITRQIGLAVDLFASRPSCMLFCMTKPPSIYPVNDQALADNDTDFRVPTISTPLFISECHEELLLRYPRARFVANYFDRPDGMREWRLTSRKDFDCSVVAKAFGGGGHKQAAGFTQTMPWPW